MSSFRALQWIFLPIYSVSKSYKTTFFSPLIVLISFNFEWGLDMLLSLRLVTTVSHTTFNLLMNGTNFKSVSARVQEHPKLLIGADWPQLSFWLTAPRSEQFYWLTERAYAKPRPYWCHRTSAPARSFCWSSPMPGVEQKKVHDERPSSGRS